MTLGGKMVLELFLESLGAVDPRFGGVRRASTGTATP